MAVNYISKGAVASGFGDASIAPPLPAGVVEGDLLLAVTVGYSLDVASPAIAWSAGWTEIDQQSWRPSVAEIDAAMAYRIATGADVAPTVSWTGTPTTAAQVFKFTGADADSFGAISVNTGEVNPHTSPAVVTTSDDSKVLYIDMGYQTTPVLVNPAGWTALSADNGTYLQINLGEKDIPTAGTSSGAISTTGSSSIAWIQWQLEVAPAAVVGTSLLTLPAIDATGTGITDSLGSSVVSLFPVSAIGYAYSGNSSDLVYPFIVADGTALPGIVGTSDQAILPIVAWGVGGSANIYPLVAGSAVVVDESSTAAWAISVAAAATMGGTASCPTFHLGVVVSGATAAGIAVGVRTLTAEVTASVVANGGIVGSATYHLSGVSITQIMDGVRFLQDYWDGWAYNLNTGAPSFYEDFKFNSFARIGNKYYGCNSTGIHLLSGNSDDGASINMTVTMAKSDLSTDRIPGDTLKTLAGVYVSASSGEPMVLTCRVEGEEYSYLFRTGEEPMAVARVIPGQGLEGNLWELELSNQDGAAVEIHGVEIVVDGKTRRI